MTTQRVKKTAITSTHGVSCDKLLALLNDYVDGDVDPGVCKELETHLAHCNPCQVVVDTVKKTITLYHDDKPCELPASFRKKLHACLRKHWKPAEVKK